MPLDKKSLKAHLLRQYATQLDDLLEQIEPDQDLKLTEIEGLALNVRHQVGQDVTETLALHESAKQEVDVTCPDCGEIMRYKGRKSKWLKTRTGDVRVERPYYSCDHCQSGHFPPG
jgi:predicted RNA-binding Zn-ribbon protein involved in translation (DUF1610 family)